MSPLKIAMVAPPFGPIGGPEMVVKHLTDALIKKGIDVTLFAPADWRTKAKHIPTLKQSLWNMKDFQKQSDIVRRDYITASQVKVLTYQDEFDLIHLHLQRWAYAVGVNAKKPCVLTLHSMIDKPEFDNLQAAKIHMVSLSQTQKGKFETFATVHNGIPVKATPYSTKPGRYFISVARFSPQKGIDRAIQLARKAGVKLLLFGRIGTAPDRQQYYQKKIKPFIDQKQIIYKGEVSNQQIYRYLRGATALLFPIRQPETYALLPAEALANGTPVIGTQVGPLPELLGGHRQIAFLSNDTRKLVAAMKNTDQLFDRQTCRDYAEKFCDSAVMAGRYLKVYHRVLKKPSRN